MSIHGCIIAKGNWIIRLFKKIDRWRPDREESRLQNNEGETS